MVLFVISFIYLSSKFFMNKKRSHEVSLPMAPLLRYFIALGGLGDMSISFDIVHDKISGLGFHRALSAVSISAC